MSATTLNTANQINRKTDVFVRLLAEMIATLPMVILQLITEELRMREQIAHLRALPDYLLDDAGIARPDIARTVRGRRRQAGS
ncbi:MAG: DUF1127 domain-containing protein [Rhodospirillales bacterium]|nr:DUF1127 domain-containing protein [Rhodospirillales bacterium]MBO6788090.1 DUF1127 domain-containing protein [Rhodospirillales bacterium]